MMFEADPEQISRLDSKQLVQLMRRLLMAECRMTGIPVRSATAPLQITISDGGEDGRVAWQAGAASTDYFPARFCIFQSKAQNLMPSTVAKEITAIKGRAASKRSTKKSKKTSAKSKEPVLNEAITKVLSRRGAYVVFCSRAFTGPKIEELQAAIARQIRKAGKAPSRAAAIEIYDANRIADWVNTHPAVALWLAAKDRKRSLGGFSSHESWGRSADINKIAWVAKGARFEVHTSTDDKTVSAFDDVADLVLKRFAENTVALRIAGASGFGKTRLAYEIFNRHSSLIDEVETSAVIYTDFSIVGTETQVLAQELADDGRPVILVVDECPDHAHRQLADLARRQGSRLRIVSIDVETKIADSADTLVVRVKPADDAMIGEIAVAAAPDIGESEKHLIQELSRGFPRMAILAAQEQGRPGRTIHSAAELVERIVWGRSVPNENSLRALEVLSLFEWVGLEGAASSESQAIADGLAGMPLDSFVEKIKSFAPRGILVQRGDFIQVSPIPLAASLAAHRLSVFPDQKLKTFFLAAPERLRKGLLLRMRWLDTTTEAKQFAKAILDNACLGNLSALNTDAGAEYLDRLVHVDPDLVADTIRRVFSGLSDSDLERITDARRHLVWTLERLVFRKESFTVAGTLLRRLAAHETEERISNNATGQFKQLYQIHLSGTEAPPELRLPVLDEGLNSKNEKEREVCVEALGQMLDTHHFSRSGGAEEIGSGERLVDWGPKTYGDIRAFLQAGITRLTTIANDERDALRQRAKKLLGSHIRGLLTAMPLADVKVMIGDVTHPGEVWIEALQEVNEWLYFDRKGAPKDVADGIRSYFDELLPSDPVELVVLYAYGWAADFNDPDVDYKPEHADFDYAVRKTIELAETISNTPALISKAIARLVTSDAKSLRPFAKRLAEVSRDPVALFRSALKQLQRTKEDPNVQFIGGLITGIDSSSPRAARECVRLAIRSKRLKGNAIALIASKKLDAVDLKLVQSLLKSGDVTPWQCAMLSYGRGTEHLAGSALLPLLNELAEKGSEGLWAALEMLSMTIYGDKNLTAPLVTFTKKVLVAPTLFDKVARANIDGHRLEMLVKYLSRRKLIDSKFAKKLANQLLSICASNRSGVFHQLDHSVRSALSLLVDTHPRDVWSTVSPMLLKQVGVYHHRLWSLIEPERQDQLKGGLLNSLPTELYLSWVRKRAAERAAIVVEWLPIALRRDDSSLYWHPALEAYINEFGHEPHVLGAVLTRLHPRSWSGSLVPYLQKQISLLTSWLQHPKAEVREWSERAIYRLRKEIEVEQKRDAEDEVRIL